MLRVMMQFSMEEAFSLLTFLQLQFSRVSTGPMLSSKLWNTRKSGEKVKMKELDLRKLSYDRWQTFAKFQGLTPIIGVKVR